MKYQLLKRQLKWYFIMFTTCFLQVVAVSFPPWVHGTMEHFKVKLVCCVISVWTYACIYMIAATSVVYFIVLYSIFNIQILTIKKTKILALSLLQCFFHLLGIFPPHIWHFGNVFFFITVMIICKITVFKARSHVSLSHTWWVIVCTIYLGWLTVSFGSSNLLFLR